MLTTDQTADRFQQKSSPLLSSMDKAGVEDEGKDKKEKMKVLHHAF